MFVMSNWLEKHLPKIVLAPSFIAIILFVYGFIAWTAWVSFTKSRLMPKYDIVGFIQYERLFDSPRWDVAINNLFIFGFLFILISFGGCHGCQMPNKVHDKGHDQVHNRIHSEVYDKVHTKVGDKVHHKAR